MKLFVFFIFCTSYSLFGDFRQPVSYGKILNDSLIEASGICISNLNENLFYSHNDGNDSKIYGFDLNGIRKALYIFEPEYLSNSSDFEDIAIASFSFSSNNYILLADIGDNSASRKEKHIHFIPELSLVNNDLENLYFPDISKNYITFEYEDGAKDAETLLYDPISQNIYIVSKREPKVSLYEIKLNGKLEFSNETKIITKTATLPIGSANGSQLSYIVGGDISKDGSRIALKSYTQIYIWNRIGNENISNTLTRNYDEVINIPLMFLAGTEPQGEAITWNKNASVLYTISEEFNNSECRISMFEENINSVKLKDFEDLNAYYCNELLYINFLKNTADTICLRIVDFNGKTVFNTSFNNFNSQLIIDLSREYLANGTYFANIIMDKNTYSLKFIIE